MRNCCASTSGNKETKELPENLKGGKMDKKVILWIIIAILIIAVVYVTFMKGNTGSAVSTAQSAGQAAGSYGGMVGGC